MIAKFFRKHSESKEMTNKTKKSLTEVTHIEIEKLSWLDPRILGYEL